MCRGRALPTPKGRLIPDAGIDALPVAAVSATLIFSQTVNFHHYTVDAVVWKLRTASVRRTAGAVES